MVLSWTRARLYVASYYYSLEAIDGQELNGFVT